MGWWRRQEANTRALLVGLCVIVLVLIAGMAVLVAFSGDGKQPDTPLASSVSTTSSSAVAATAATVTSTSTAEATSSSTSTAATATTAATAATATSLAISSDAIAYAESLGGTSQKGKTLYLVVGAMVDSEQAAQTMLDGATPRFGDMQSYFVVQLSDNFEGMEPGWWVVIEAYRGEPSAENLAFDRRGFSDVYVIQTTVKTADPIPVYEDLVG